MTDGAGSAAAEDLAATTRPPALLSSTRVGRDERLVGSEPTDECVALGRVLTCASPLWPLAESEFAALMVRIVRVGPLNGRCSVVALSLPGGRHPLGRSSDGRGEGGRPLRRVERRVEVRGRIALWKQGTELSLTGFQPSSDQKETALHGLRLMGGSIPVVLHAISFFLLARFTLDESADRALGARLH